MSSRRLLVLIACLPDDSSFARALREGDWSLAEYLQAAQVNELRSLRADQAALKGQKMDFEYVESPRQVEAREESSAVNEAVRDGILAQLHAGLREETSGG